MTTEMMQFIAIFMLFALIPVVFMAFCKSDK
nr:MAG TPA: hypothetical protein [Caudoviricetes sp.]